MTDPFVIETRDLRKNYGGTEAVSGLTLQVPTGSIYGFLGRNGAGKTTTIKLLLGMAQPTSGQARVFGLAADALQYLSSDECRDVFPYRCAAVAGTPRQRGAVDGPVVRRRCQHGAPGFLTAGRAPRYLERSSPGSAGLAWPSGTTAGPLPPSSNGASSSRTRCRCRTLRFRLI
jgi:energy-coupling factor transporter ATP-binding protein EcfA2